MDMRAIQTLLAKAGEYGGNLDGQAGPKTLAAINNVLTKNFHLCVSDPHSWTPNKRSVAAAQIILHNAGLEPGAVDGYAGHNTVNAYNTWLYEKINGTTLILPSTPSKTSPKSSFPLQKDCKVYYGDPAKDQVQQHLVVIDTPYVMRIDYDLTTRSTKMRLHYKCASSATAAMKEIVDHYGFTKLQQLGLDRFAGSYFKRLMRGSSTTWSMHAYGCAIDWYAEPNGLTTRAPDALFSGKAYIPFFDIWEKHGWVSLGRAIGRDWMHVQAARI